MSDTRDQGIREELSLLQRNRLRSALWLPLLLTLVAALAVGAMLFADTIARSAQRDADKASHEELTEAIQALRETALALRTIQDGERSARSEAAGSHVLAAQKRLVGELLVDLAMYRRHWESMEQNESFRPVVQGLVKHLSQQEYASRSIDPHASEGPNAPRDEFERNLLTRFMQDRPSEKRPISFAERDSAGQSRREYYQAVYAEKSCLLCHKTGNGPFDLGGGSVTPVAAVSGGAPVQNVVPLKEGDLMAFVQVVVPAPRSGGK